MESLQSTQGALLFGVWFSLYEESDKEISPRLFVRFKKTLCPIFLPDGSVLKS